MLVIQLLQLALHTLPSTSNATDTDYIQPTLSGNTL